MGSAGAIEVPPEKIPGLGEKIMQYIVKHTAKEGGEIHDGNIAQNSVDSEYLNLLVQKITDILWSQTLSDHQKSIEIRATIELYNWKKSSSSMTLHDVAYARSADRDDLHTLFESIIQVAQGASVTLENMSQAAIREIGDKIRQLSSEIGSVQDPASLQQKFLAIQELMKRWKEHNVNIAKEIEAYKKLELELYAKMLWLPPVANALEEFVLRLWVNLSDPKSTFWNKNAIWWRRQMLADAVMGVQEIFDQMKHTTLNEAYRAFLVTKFDDTASLVKESGIKNPEIFIEILQRACKNLATSIPAPTNMAWIPQAPILFPTVPLNIPAWMWFETLDDESKAVLTLGEKWQNGQHRSVEDIQAFYDVLGAIIHSCDRKLEPLKYAQEKSGKWPKPKSLEAKNMEIHETIIDTARALQDTITLYQKTRDDIAIFVQKYNQILPQGLDLESVIAEAQRLKTEAERLNIGATQLDELIPAIKSAELGQKLTSLTENNNGTIETAQALDAAITEAASMSIDVQMARTSLSRSIFREILLWHIDSENQETKEQISWNHLRTKYGLKFDSAEEDFLMHPQNVSSFWEAMKHITSIAGKCGQDPETILEALLEHPHFAHIIDGALPPEVMQVLESEVWQQAIERVQKGISKGEDPHSLVQEHIIEGLGLTVGLKIPMGILLFLILILFGVHQYDKSVKKPRQDLLKSILPQSTSESPAIPDMTLTEATGFIEKTNEDEVLGSAVLQAKMLQALKILKDSGDADAINVVKMIETHKKSEAGVLKQLTQILQALIRTAQTTHIL
jgi:hypothetical protein